MSTEPSPEPDLQLVSPFPWRPSRVLVERLVLAALLIGLLALKLSQATTEPAYGPDASYYYDIAAHVRDGHGLVTDVSLFNAGYEHFPHPTAVYPLWPLVLGLVGGSCRLSQVAAIRLPTLFYFAAIVLAYRLARRVAPDPLFPETWPVLHAGHVAAAVVALTNAMFLHTSKPFTEGLGYFLLLLALTRAERLSWAERVAWPRARRVVRPCDGPQPAGPRCDGRRRALAWAGASFRLAALARAALAFVVGLVAVLGVQLVHLAGFADGPRLVYLLRFDFLREPSELAALEVMVRPPGVLAWIADRARGVPIAFGGGPMSYAHCFGLWSAALLLAVPFLVLDGWRAVQRRSTGLWAWLDTPANLFRLAYALLAMVVSSRCTRSTRPCSRRGTSARGTRSRPGLRLSRRFVPRAPAGARSRHRGVSRRRQRVLRLLAHWQRPRQRAQVGRPPRSVERRLQPSDHAVAGAARRGGTRPCRRRPGHRGAEARAVHGWCGIPLDLQDHDMGGGRVSVPRARRAVPDSARRQGPASAPR